MQYLFRFADSESNWRLDCTTRLYTLSDEAAPLFGLPPGSRAVSENVLLQSMLAADAGRFLDGIAQVLNSTLPVLDEQCRFNMPDGSVRYIRFLAKRGKSKDCIGLARDVTQAVESEKRAQQHEKLVRIAGRVARMGGWIADLSIGRVYWSDEVCDIHEVPHGTFPTVAEAINYYPLDWRPTIARVFEECAATGKPFDQVLQILTSTGRRVWVRAVGEAVHDESGKINCVQGAFQDVSEQKKSEEDTQRLTSRLVDTLETMSDAFLTIDREWRFLYANREAQKLLGHSKAEMVGRNIWELFPEAVHGGIYDGYHRAMEQKCTVLLEEFYEPFNMWFDIKVYPSDEGISVYFRDITERKRTEMEIYDLAFNDTLTGLPNRQLLLSHLTKALEMSKRSRRQGAVLFIDLDNFKGLNDTYGHDKGDLLLKQVGQRLSAAVRGCDTVARFGGDEFVLLLEELGESEREAGNHARVVAQKIIDSFGAPFNLDGFEHFSTPSIGITLFDANPVGIDEILKRADLAMYQAKENGRNTIAFFDPAMQEMATARAELETDLRHALAASEFLLHYQPQVNDQGHVTGVEALVRWRHPKRGLVSPAEFIPVCEETGLIQALGDWVLNTACMQLARWAEHPATAGLTMAVNVSARQCHHPDFVRHVRAAIEKTGANPKRLKLELTESLLVYDIEDTILKMNALKEHGVGFSLDDFGTGYSCLTYLHLLPLDQLKIDQSFIRDALSSEQSAAIVRTIIALGRTLGLAVLAEGVETEEQRRFIESEGCGAYQGYLFSRPLPIDELERFIGCRPADQYEAAVS
jgi:diguanylate cyclase (GGDEF)-like protein/PAS domain S-box-containing protein